MHDAAGCDLKGYRLGLFHAEADLGVADEIAAEAGQHIVQVVDARALRVDYEVKQIARLVLHEGIAVESHAFDGVHVDIALRDAEPIAAVGQEIEDDPGRIAAE